MKRMLLREILQQSNENGERNAATDTTYSLAPTHVDELENAYAEALGDGADAQTLASLWDEIKKCKMCARQGL